MCIAYHCILQYEYEYLREAQSASLDLYVYVQAPSQIKVKCLRLIFPSWQLSFTFCGIMWLSDCHLGEELRWRRSSCLSPLWTVRGGAADKKTLEWNTIPGCRTLSKQQEQVTRCNATNTAAKDATVWTNTRPISSICEWVIAVDTRYWLFSGVCSAHALKYVTYATAGTTN